MCQRVCECGKSRQIECGCAVWPNGVGKLRSAAAAATAAARGKISGGESGGKVSKSGNRGECGESTCCGLGTSIFLIFTSSRNSKSSINSNQNTNSCSKHSMERKQLERRSSCSNRKSNSHFGYFNSNFYSRKHTATEERNRFDNSLNIRSNAKCNYSNFNINNIKRTLSHNGHICKANVKCNNSGSSCNNSNNNSTPAITENLTGATLKDNSLANKEKIIS